MTECQNSWKEKPIVASQFVTQLQQLYQANPAGVTEMLSVFQEDFSSFAQELTQAIKTRELHQISRINHKLLGESLILGAEQLCALIRSIKEFISCEDFESAAQSANLLPAAIEQTYHSLHISCQKGTLSH